MEVICIKKILVRNWPIGICIHCVRTLSWFVPTMSTLMNSHLIKNLIEDLNWNENIFWDLPTFMIVFQVKSYLVKTFIHRKKEKECSFRNYLAPLHISLLEGVKNVNLLLFFTQDIFYELLENPIRYRFHDMTRWLFRCQNSRCKKSIFLLMGVIWRFYGVH